MPVRELMDHTENYKRLKNIFEEANQKLIYSDKELFRMRVSERTICGAFMIHLHEALKQTPFKDYSVDIEYNRNKGGKLKTYIKTVNGPENIPVKINCDLIVHSRGNNLIQDNLMAIEMKKSSRAQRSKESDRVRLMSLTKGSFDNIWSFDGKTFPEHVCRYALGIYYEINFNYGVINLEFYKDGYLSEKDILKITLD